MLIVDSTVLIDLLGNTKTPETEWLETNAYSRVIGLTDLILCEVLQGVRNEQEFKRIRSMLDRLVCFHTGGRKLAMSAAINYRSPRTQGITVRKTIDCIIATFCIENGHVLLHRDRDFDHFEQHLGLKVVKV